MDQHLGNSRGRVDYVSGFALALKRVMETALGE